MHTKNICATIVSSLLLTPLCVPASTAQPPSVASEQPYMQRISVQTQGSGSDVILIPGLASSRDVWAGLAADLRQRHRVHLIELAGFASTPAIPIPEGKILATAVDVIAEYIRTQHINAPAIIGHSLGGEIALMLAARHPDLAGRLMVVDALPFYTLTINPAATSETARSQAKATREWLLAQSPEQRMASQKISVARLVKNEAARPALVAAGINSDPKTVADAVYDLMVTDLRPELSRIRVPIGIVYAYDPLFGVPAARVDAMYRQAYASAPDTHFTRIDNSFHFIMLDQPKLFSSAVETFLDK